MHSLAFLFVVVIVVSVSDASRLLFDANSVDDSAAAASPSSSLPVVCPDAKSTCDGQSTCCASAGDGRQFACCPLKNAQCCSDGLHCCPQGTRCNAERASCDPLSANASIPAVRKAPAPTTTTTAPSTTPPNAWLTCPDRSQCTIPGSACCRQYSNRYSCCLYPLNVCCDDGLHCCHVGTVCDPLHLVCKPYPPSSSRLIPWSELVVTTAAVPQAAPAVDDIVICPDGSLCDDGHTCCAIFTGGYGCCPMKSAVCCSDKMHCCPYGYKCSVGGGCVANDRLSLPWASFKVKAVKP